MSIIIKGIEMPTKHFIKGFYIDGETGNVLDISRKNIIGHAIEVPTPHGRLIDVDAIQGTHAIARCLDDGHNWNELCMTMDEIVDMPTVIEAEE